MLRLTKHIAPVVELCCFVVCVTVLAFVAVYVSSPDEDESEEACRSEYVSPGGPAMRARSYDVLEPPKGCT
jgi:hypothetical protein